MKLPSLLLVALALAFHVSAGAQLLPHNKVSVTLAWDKSPDTNVTGYNVYYGVAPRMYTNVVDARTATSVTISNLVLGTTYYFAATCYTAIGLESEFSSEVSWTAPAPIQPPTMLHYVTNSVYGSSQPFSSLTMERSETLLAWEPVGDVWSGSDGSFVFLDLNPPPLRAFYRTSQ